MKSRQPMSSFPVLRFSFVFTRRCFGDGWRLSTEVKVSCTKSVDMDALRREVEVQDMTISRDRNNRNVIVFVGIFADNDFDEGTILKVVQRFDKKASIFSVSPLN